MRLFAVTLAVLLAFGASGTSLVRAADDAPDAAAKLAELLARSPKNAAFKADDKPDAPVTLLLGDLADGVPGHEAETCEQFVTRFGAVLGFPAGGGLKDLTLLTNVQTDGGRVLSYAPAIKGVPYLKSNVVMSVGADGHLNSVSGRFVKLTGAQAGSLSGAQAVRRALAELAKKYPGAMITGDGTVEEFLADEDGGGIAQHYRIDLAVGYPPDHRTVILGPGGNLISERHGGATEEWARVMPTVTKTDLDKRPLKDLTKPDGIFTSWKIDGTYFTSTSSAEAITSLFGHFDPDPFDDSFISRTLHPHTANPQFLEGNVYYWLTEAHAKALAWGAKEVDDHKPMKFDVWSSSTDNNAFFAEGGWKLVFASDNSDKDYWSPAMDSSIICHEYGHSVQRALAAHYDEGGTPEELLEANTIGEGFGDLFAAAILDNPEHATLWNSGKASRNLTTTMKLADVKPLYEDEATHGEKTEIHQASQVFSGALWEYRKKHGADEMMKLVIEGLRRAPSPHTFAHVAAGLLAADAALSGEHDHREELTQILTDHGFMPVAAPPPSH